MELSQKQGVNNKYIIITPVVIGLIMIVARYYNALLFHSLAEFFAIFVAFMMSVVVWHTYNFSKNNYLMYLGCGYVWVGVLDTGHMLTFTGLGIFANEDPNITLQFWIIARFFEALLLLSSPLFLTRELNRTRYIYGFGVLAVVSVYLVMTSNMPVMYVPKVGLTAVKVYTEYFIIAILALAAWHVFHKRHLIARDIYYFVIASIACTAFAEYAFTLYIGFFDISTIVGHILKFISYWLIYVAIVRTTLIEPFDIMARSATTYDAIGDPVIVVDREAKIRELNREAKTQAGKQEHELIGQSCHYLFHDKGISEKDCTLCQDIIAGTAPDVLVIRHINNKNWTEVRLSPIKSASGLEGYVHVSHSITDRKHMEEAVRQSEKQLSAILANIQDVIFRTDTDNNIIWASPSITTLTGYGQDEITGLPLQNLYLVPEEHEHFVSLLGDTNGHITNHEIKMKRKDWSSFTALISAQYYYDENQVQILGLEGSIRDISSLKLAEDRLVKSERRYKSLVENLPIKYFIYSIDKNGNYYYVSPSVTSVLGYSQRDFLQYHETYVSNHPANKLAANYHQEILRGEKVEPFEIEYIKSDGSNCIMEMSQSLVRDEEGNIMGIDGIAHDITNKKGDQQEREQLYRQLQQAQKMEAIGQLTGGIAHDFNNILASILGYTELALDKFAQDKDSKLHNYLNEIHTAGGRARDLISQMMAYSRGGSSNPQALYIKPLVNEVIKLLQSTIPASISVDTYFESELPRIVVDPVQLHQIIMNLCINARDAMHGHGHLDILVKTETLLHVMCDSCHHDFSGKYLVIEVKDTGSGFDEQVKQRIFDPFFTTKETGKGTGMGLSVVHGIVHEHHGHIIVESEPGSGTTFKLFFPIKSGQALPVKSDASDRQDTQTGHGNIMIVDDEISVARFLGEYLSSYGFKTSVFTDPFSAIETFDMDTQAFDLVITDLTMPEMNGDEMAEILVTRRKSLPIILCSGYSEMIDLESSKEKGISCYIDKPIDGAKLIKMINSLLDKNQQDYQ